MSDELDELTSRLQLVYGKVGGDQNAVKRGKDKFENLKYDVVKQVEALNKLCDLRDKRRDGTRDSAAVRLRHQMRTVTSVLKTNIGMLRAMYEKDVAKANKKKKKKTKQQLKKRGKTLDSVEQLVQDALDRAHPEDAAARKRDEEDDDDIPRFDVETGEIVDGRGSPIDFEGVQVKTQEMLTDSDRQALATMQEEKNTQDDLLDEIGDVVTHLGVLARGIGEELDIQNIQLADVERDVDDVTAKVNRANDRLDETLKLLNSKSDKLCCYVIFIIVLLGLLSIVFNMLF